MTTTAHNTVKHRLETVDVELADKNTTWFDSAKAHHIQSITDVDGGLLIAESNYNYPIWVDGVSRTDINHCGREARKLLDSLKGSGREK